MDTTGSDDSGSGHPGPGPGSGAPGPALATAPAPEARQRRRAEAPWGRFWLLTSAASVSELGNTFLNLAMPWTVLGTTHSSIMAALSLGVQYLPFVASPVLGTMIDRYERRMVFMVSELAQGFLVALVPLLLMAHQVLVALLVLLVAGFGTVASNLTSDFSLLPRLAPGDRMAEAYSRYAASIQLGRTAGPAVAGVVLAAVGGYWALWIDAATFLLTVLAAVALPRGGKPVVERGFLRMQVEGFRHFRRIRGIPRLTVVLSLYNLGAGAVPVVILVLVGSAWDWSSSLGGLVLAAGSAGSALGSWLGGRVWTDARSERRIGLWLTVSAAACVGLLTPWHAVVILGFCGLMAGEGAVNVTTNEYRFRAIPEALTGRVNAVMRGLILSTAGLSALLLGWSVSLPDHVLRLAPAALTSALAVLVWLGVRRSRPE